MARSREGWLVAREGWLVSAVSVPVRGQLGAIATEKAALLRFHYLSQQFPPPVRAVTRTRVEFF
jgi:hypothetical protein